ncbi:MULTISPECIES: hypothetical protein [Fervidobacterium]|uniref:hypothetical protein n=1 Tax=Fervidobacterium TaxID=2422 RepID=UPI00059DA36C|nr:MULTISPECIES: hypothetical protein [Fervidobacterium]KAF2961469.1 hypothetical protein AS161_01385 [Fervidobacterium sp. 2310opik-2]PHJ13420.1 hypothetical protein IM41_06035 [Fervidobacterium sp. SC_NGM5_G05]
MAEPISGVQNQTIILKAGHESSHITSLQQYMAQSAIANSAQNVQRRTQQELNAPKNVGSTEQKRTQSSTEGKSQGEYQPRQNKKESESFHKVTKDNSHILDVRV